MSTFSGLASAVRSVGAVLARSGPGGGSGAPAARAGVRAVTALALSCGVLLALGASPALAQSFTFTGTFGSSGSGNGQFSAPIGVAIDQASGDVYVADNGNNRVEVFSSSGAYLSQFAVPADNGAFGVAVAQSSGDLYVADNADSVLYQFSSSGSLLATFGSAGSGNGQLNAPEGVAVDPTTGDLWVADTGNNRVEEFDSSGAYVSQIGVSNPQSVAVDLSGDLYVSSGSLGGSGVVEKYSSSGTALYALDASGSPDPFVVVVDGSGDVFVYDAPSSTMYEYDDTGAEVTSFAENTVDQSELLGMAFGDTAQTLYLSGVTQDEVAMYGPVVAAAPSVDAESSSGITPVAATLSAQINPNFADTTCEFEYVDAADYNPSASDPYSAGQTAACSQADLGSGNSDVPTSAALASLSPNTTYHWRAVATNSVNTTDGTDQTFTTLPSVSIDLLGARGVGPTNATLVAQLNPNGADTTYHFEYGTADCQTSACTSVPVPNADIGSGTSDVAVSQSLTRLAPATTYHYRVVATNSYGPPVTSADHTFTTFAPVGPFSLPDGRAYEMVSPVDKQDGEVGAIGGPTGLNRNEDQPFQSALDGNSVAYEGDASSAGNGETGSNEYLAQRGSTGWSVADLSPVNGPPDVVAFSSDLSRAVLTTEGGTALAAGAPDGYADVYVRDDTTGAYTALNTTTPPNQSALNFTVTYMGASPDLSHVVFAANDALTQATASAPAAQEPAGANADDLYEWTGGELRLVNVLPGNSSTDPNVVLGAGSVGDPDVSNAISSDGSMIFFSDLDNGNLYVRENGTTTVQVDAAVGGGGQFWTASTDGSEVLFTKGGDLYEFDTATSQTTDLAPSGDVLGVVGASSDASYVYFVAGAVLASGASAGQDNLYLANGGTTSFIATLSPRDNALLLGAGDWVVNFGYRTAAVTADGLQLAFNSQKSLTGYDNTDGNSDSVSYGTPDEEVYLYDASSGKLTCASCNPSGAEPIGESYLPPSQIATYQPRWLTDDGNRLFFDSYDELVPQDTNGSNNNSYGQDVYEWEQDGTGSCQTAGGCVYLISNGQATDNSYFDDASPSGNDVFFTTRAQLVPQDQDQLTDLYDARVGGGFPYAPPGAPCSGDACKGPISAPPATPTVASVTFAGPGDTSSGSSAITGRLKVVKKAVKGAKFVLTVKVPAKGRISVSGVDVKSVGKSVGRAGTYRLTPRLSAKPKRQLKRKRKLNVKVRVAYRPSDGSASSVTVSMTVKA